MLITLSDNRRLNNEAQWPKTYTRKFIEQGLVDYQDMGLDTLLLRKETIDKILESFTDKPVIIRHKKVDEANFNDRAVGFIKKVYFNPGDGWYYVDFLINKDEGHEAMEKGWGVSCAYTVNQLGGGGKYHNIDYQGEILDGAGEHLALVENPRYEDCLMMVNHNGHAKQALLYNEKDFANRKTVIKVNQEDTTMRFNFFGKKDDKGFKGDTLVDLGNGKKAKLADIMAVCNAPAPEKHEIEGDQEIELANGTKIKLADAITAYNASTDKGEEKDEKDNKEGAEGKKAENATKFKNCACGGEKEGKHADNCAMYNSDGSDKENKDEKDMKNSTEAVALANEVKRLKLENEALKNGIEHNGTFVRVSTAKANASESDAMDLTNATHNSGDINEGLKTNRKFFEPKKTV